MTRFPNRVRRLLITPELFVEMATNGCDAVAVVKNALPKDARYSGLSTFNPDSACVQVFVESAEFDEVAEGTIVPQHPMVYFEKVAR